MKVDKASLKAIKQQEKIIKNLLRNMTSKPTNNLSVETVEELIYNLYKL